MNFKKIFVLGAGAIGSYYGALLSRKNDVTLIGKADHVEAVNNNGLEISGDMQKRFYIKANTNIEKVPSNTLILLTTKIYDSEKAIKKIKHLLKNDTVILILQNGLGNKETVIKILGKQQNVLRGLVTIGSEFLKPGKITFRDGETILEQTEISKKIAKFFNKCGLKTRVSEEFKKESWNKFIVNCVINPLTAILKVRDNEILINELKKIRYGIVNECLKIRFVRGRIPVETNLERHIDKKVLQYTNYSSMYQDLVKGKKTEIDSLNGKLIDIGIKNGIRMPFNETLVSLVKSLEVTK